MAGRELSVRWTIGNVSTYGFEALRLSIRGAWRLFGPEAVYAVCVHSVPLEEARRRAGSVPQEVTWRSVTQEEIFPPSKARLDHRLADGVEGEGPRVAKVLSLVPLASPSAVTVSASPAPSTSAETAQAELSHRPATRAVPGPSSDLDNDPLPVERG